MKSNFLVITVNNNPSFPTICGLHCEGLPAQDYISQPSLRPGVVMWLVLTNGKRVGGVPVSSSCLLLQSFRLYGDAEPFQARGGGGGGWGAIRWRSLEPPLTMQKKTGRWPDIRLRLEQEMNFPFINSLQYHIWHYSIMPTKLRASGDLCRPEKWWVSLASSKLTTAWGSEKRLKNK